MTNILTLPRDILLHIIGYLNTPDRVSLNISNKIINTTLFDKLEDMKKNKCMDDIEDYWNLLECDARNLAIQKLDRYHIPPHGLQVEQREQFECLVHHMVHDIKVVYVYNPRDVNMVALYLDGERCGWTMH